MKYLILRCEDGARASSKTAALLEGAKTAALQQLAQAGAAGVIRPPANRQAVDRLAVHRGLFGLAADEAVATAGDCYAASMDVTLAAGETAWCCELTTQQDGTLIDPTAGQITTKESAVLVQALNAQLGSEARRWQLGEGSHHLLVTHDAALQSDRQLRIPAPELFVGQPWKRHLPRHPVVEALQRVAEQARELLEAHPVNRVRIDLGENPANFLWLWGGGGRQGAQTFTERTTLSGAVISSSFPMRGLASALKLDWKPGPPSLGDRALQRLAADIGALSGSHDLVYVHLRVDSADPVERLCAMERIDQRLAKPLSEGLSDTDRGRLLVAVDDLTTGSVLFVAVGSGLPTQPVAHLHGPAIAESPLAFAEAAALFAWFVRS